MSRPKTYYHFTCDHGAHGIARTGLLLPHKHPLLSKKLVWLTDLAVPDRWGLGLTSNWITCDRTLNRASVQSTATIVPWRGWALLYEVPDVLIEVMEESARPDRWWVSETPLRVSDLSSMAIPRSQRRAS
ncbi:hypothetical protein [Amycolatopsis sp. SB7-3]|uniref:hypothetical protein n=1 Tax=Amycolatopsis sp. SB7-3 TaxID=3373438 RepID=UPI00374433A1